MKLKIDKFVLAIILVILVAAFFPDWGSKSSGIPFETITSIGIALIFFFYGLKLSPEKLKTGMVNLKLHLLIQVSTFLLFPLIVITVYPFVKSEDARAIWLGFLFLAALPSTVSSSVVMVSMAKGNIPAAIFNASISGLIGIIITPLWMGLFVQKTHVDFELGAIYLKLLTEILLPVVIGLLLHRFFGQTAIRYSRYLTLFDKTIILIIIFRSFANSFNDGVFKSVDYLDLLKISVLVLALFFSVYYFTGWLVKKLKFTFEDRITARFCGSKKSLVHGTVFAKVLFASTMPVGLLLLPLMLYHALQIFIVSIIAARLGKNR